MANKTFRWFDLSKYDKKIVLTKSGADKKLVVVGKISEKDIQDFAQIGFTYTNVGTLENSTILKQDEILQLLKQIYPDIQILETGDICADGSEIQRSRFYINLDKEDVRLAFKQDLNDSKGLEIEQDLENEAEMDIEMVPEEAEQEASNPENVSNTNEVSSEPSDEKYNDDLYIRVQAEAKSNKGCLSPELAQEIRNSGREILKSLPSYIVKRNDANEIYEVNGIRYALFAKYQNGEVPVVAETPLIYGPKLLRGNTMEHRMNLFYDLVQTLESSPIRGYEFRNFVRVVYGLESDAEIPNTTINEARNLMNTAINRSVLSHGSSKTIDRWRRLSRITENNASQAIIPPTVPMAIIRSLALEQFAPEDRRVFVRNDSFGFMATTPSNITTGMSVISHSLPENDSLIKRTYREAGIDDSKIIREVPENASYEFIVDMDAKSNTDVINNLAIRKDNGRSVFIMPYESMTSEQINLIARNYRIDSIIDINFPLPGAETRNYQATILAVGNKRENVRENDEDVMQFLDRRTINNTPALWTWAASVVSSREAGNEIEENTEDNDYQTPYSPMSKLHESATMVPKNLLYPTLELQQRVMKLADGDIDQYVADALGKTKDELKTFLSAEQIDGVMTGLYRSQREQKDGDAVLVADDTGIGKGRECCSLGYSMVRRGERMIYMTEYGTSFSDVWREFRTIGASDDIKPFIFNNERIYDEKTGEIIMEPTPRHIITGATARSHWPDGSPMHFILLNRKEAGRLKRRCHEILGKNSDASAEEKDEAFFLKKILRGRQITLLNEEELPEIVDNTEIQKEWIESPSYNTLFTSYSQINKASIENQKKKKNPTRNDKTQFMMDVFNSSSKEVNPISIVLDESQNAASNTSNMGKNVQVLVDKAKTVVYASATWSKGVKSLSIYHRLFSQFMNIGQISEIMNEGGATIQETLTRLMVSEGSYIRRELDSSKCEFATVVGDKYKERNIEIVDSIAPVLSAIAVMGGQIDERISLLNRAREAEREIIEREVRGNVVTNFFSSNPFGSSLSQFSRILTRSMSLDIVVDEALNELKQGHKPVIALESTLERFVTRVKAANSDPTYVPDIKDYLRHILVSSLQIKAPDGQKINIAEEDKERDSVDAIIQSFVSKIPECMKQAENEHMTLDEKEDAIKEFLSENSHSDIRVFILELMNDCITEYVVHQYENNAEFDDNALTRIWNLCTEQLTRFQYNQNNIMDFVSYAVNIADEMPMNPAQSYKMIMSMIDKVPDLPVSAIDYIKHRIAQEGYKIEEITGRNSEINNHGLLVHRHKRPKGVVKDEFNRGEIDALVAGINASTAIDLHAGRRFINQNKRVMIFAEDLRDPTKDKQMRGRVNRFDQVLNPKFTTCLTSMPVEIRRFIQQNAKSRSLSASVTANRENAHLQQNIPDIINKVGDIVAARYILANEETAKHLGLKNVLDDLKLSEKRIQEEMLKGSFFSDPESLKSNINQLIARIESLLPYHEQVRAMNEIESEYGALIEELNAAGSNPLLVKHIAGEWSCRPEDRKLISGIEEKEELSTQDSILGQPLYLEKGSFTRRVIRNSIRSSRLMTRVERNLQFLNDETPEIRSKELWDLRNTLLHNDTPLGFQGNIEDAIQEAREGTRVVSEILKQKFTKLCNLTSLLSDIQIGSLVKIQNGRESEEVMGVITNIEMPDLSDKRADMPSFYDLEYIRVGDEAASTIRLSSVLNATENFSIKVIKDSGFNSNNPEAFMEEWDEEAKKAGFNSVIRTRLLIGNEWQGVSMMVSGKFGRVVTFDTPDGIQRAIEVTNTEKFDKMPVFIESHQLASAALSEVKRIELGEVLMTQSKTESDFARISIPSPSGKNIWINENKEVKETIIDIIRTSMTDATDDVIDDMWTKSMISKNRIILGKVSMDNANLLIKCLMKSNIQCTVENIFSAKINELRNSLDEGKEEKPQNAELYIEEPTF